MRRVTLLMLALAGVPDLAVAQVTWCEAASGRLVAQAMERGDLDAQTHFASRMVDGECGLDKVGTGAELLKNAADLGASGAQFELGSRLLLGHGVTEDPAKGLDYLEAAAQAGHLDAQHFLGLLVLDRSDTEMERDEGLFWLGSAASQGSANSARAISLLFGRGMHGVDQDSCLADLWYEAWQLLEGLADDAAAPPPTSC